MCSRVLYVVLTAAREGGVAYVHASEGAWLSKQVNWLSQVLIFVDDLQASKTTDYHLDLTELYIICREIYLVSLCFCAA